MFTRSLIRIVMIGAAFCAVAAPSAIAERGQQSITGVHDGAPFKQYAGYKVSGYPGQLQLLKDGEPTSFSLANSGIGVDDLDLGADRDARPVAAYTSCNPSINRCSVRTYDLASGLQRTVRRLKVPCGRIRHVAIWRTLLAFVEQQRRDGRCHVTTEPRTYSRARLVLTRSTTAPLRTITRLKSIDGATEDIVDTDLIGHRLIWSNEHWSAGDNPTTTLVMRDPDTEQKCSLAVDHQDKYYATDRSTVPLVALSGTSVKWQSRIELGSDPPILTGWSRSSCGVRSRQIDPALAL